MERLETTYRSVSGLVRDYRVGQTLSWLYDKVALSFDEMTELPGKEREALAEAFELTAPAPIHVMVRGWAQSSGYSLTGRTQ